MKSKEFVQAVIGAIVIILGMVMMGMFYNSTPPLISGIAFVLIGAGQVTHLCKCKK
ncbi:hypothetical protein ACFL0V_02365 [Nanoarchaeota archaeon]